MVLVGGVQTMLGVRSCSGQRVGQLDWDTSRDADADRSLGGSSGGFGSGGGRWRPSAVQVVDVKHDEFSPLVGDALQDQVTLVVLEDFLHILQVLLRLLDEFP